MARLIREEIGEALWLAAARRSGRRSGCATRCGSAATSASSWKGHYSAESLLRDQTARNFANGILWQADPDCILLRDRFHELSDEQVRSLALFAGLAGGVLMTSDHLGEVPRAAARAARRARWATARPFRCDFPLLGQRPLTA